MYHTVSLFICLPPPYYGSVRTHAGTVPQKLSSGLYYRTQKLFIWFTTTVLRVCTYPCRHRTPGPYVPHAGTVPQKLFIWFTTTVLRVCTYPCRHRTPEAFFWFILPYPEALHLRTVPQEAFFWFTTNAGTVPRSSSTIGLGSIRVPLVHMTIHCN